MVIQAPFVNHIFAWLLGFTITPGVVLTFNPYVITQPLISVGVGGDVGLEVDVSVGVGICVGDTSGDRVNVSEGTAVTQHVTQGMGVDVGHCVVDTSVVGLDNAAKIVETASFVFIS